MSYLQLEGRRAPRHTIKSASRKRIVRPCRCSDGTIGLGEYEDDGFGKFKLKKILKKVTAPVAKVVQKVTSKGPLKSIKKGLRKVTAAQTGFITAGLLKPKLFGIKSKSGKKMFKIGGVAGKVVAAVTIGVIAAPFVAPYLASAGSATLGGLKFLGGKLVSAPMTLLSKLTSMGKTPQTATTDEVVKAGIETGDITPGMLEQLGGVIPGLTQALNQAPPDLSIPGEPDYGGTYTPGQGYTPGMPSEGEEGAPVAEAGLFGGGNLTPMLYLGAGFLALMMFGGKKGRSS